MIEMYERDSPVVAELIFIMEWNPNRRGLPVGWFIISIHITNTFIVSYIYSDSRVVLILSSFEIPQG